MVAVQYLWGTEENYALKGIKGRRVLQYSQFLLVGQALQYSCKVEKNAMCWLTVLYIKVQTGSIF